MNIQGHSVKRFDEKKRPEGSRWFLLTSMVKSAPFFANNTPQSKLPFAEGLSPLRYPTTPENNKPSHFIAFIAQLKSGENSQRSLLVNSACAFCNVPYRSEKTWNKSIKNVSYTAAFSQSLIWFTSLLYVTTPTLWRSVLPYHPILLF